MTSNNKDKKVPEHIGIIMDGNRRWAKDRNLPSIEGHLQGYKLAKKVPEWFFEKGVKTVSLFSFSTENWKRDASEVNYLMALLKRAIEEEAITALKKGHRVIISGNLEELPGDLPDECRRIMRETKEGKNGTINICMNYGGRTEIIGAVKAIMKDGVASEDITEEMISKYLYTRDLCDPDLIIRTSGEKRTSGFLLWQSAYSELLFLEKNWPELEKRDIDKIIDDFGGRTRRFGGN